ncbi:MAG: ATP-binding protein [Verrucomicrobiota bacterium]
MKRHFPLYAKILLWFFLNLLLLVCAFWLLLRDQFHLGREWMLAGGADTRVEALCDLILSEINERPRDQWNDTLQRVGNAYHLKLYLFRNDGTQLAGDSVTLPSETRARLMDRQGLPPRRQGAEGAGGPEGSAQDAPANAQRTDRDGQRIRPARNPEGQGFRPLPERDPMGFGPPPGAEGQAPGRPPGAPELDPNAAPLARLKFMVRTDNPSRYWLLVRLVTRDPQRLRPAPATLIGVTDSISGGGLFFDVRPWVYAMVGAVLFSALFWIPLVRNITQSVRQMTEATQQIAQGHFEVRVDEHRRDELGTLGQAINQMAFRLAGFVTGQKRFLGDIAHELCSPLARLRMALGILEQRADEKQQPYITSASEKAQLLADLVNELLSFSRASLGTTEVKLQPVSVNDAVAKAVQRETTDGAVFEIEVPDALCVMAEPELLVRAIANLLRNAVRYAGHAGPIRLKAGQSDQEVLITISDRGPGVPEAELARIFDPFYRLDTSRDRGTGGVGLGLAIVKTCVEWCQGSITCRNLEPSGLEVTLRLPISK